MSRFANSAFALAIFFGASSAAHAFLTCDPTVSNPPFPPLNPNPTYPSDPAIPFSGSHTKRTADELEINLSIDAAAPTSVPHQRNELRANADRRIGGFLAV